MKTSGQLRAEIEGFQRTIHALREDLKLAVIQDDAKAKDKQAEEDRAIAEAWNELEGRCGVSEERIRGRLRDSFISGWHARGKWKRAKDAREDPA